MALVLFLGSGKVPEITQSWYCTWNLGLAGDLNDALTVAIWQWCVLRSVEHVSLLQCFASWSGNSSSIGLECSRLVLKQVV